MSDRKTESLYTAASLAKLPVKELAKICEKKFGPLVSVTYESCDRDTLIKAIINNDDYVFYADLPKGALA